MGFRCEFVLGGMDAARFGEALSDQAFSLLLGLLTAWNETLLRALADHGLRLPHPYQAGLRYEAEPPPQEEWLDVLELYERRVGDCEDLAAALAAWLRVFAGVDARCGFARRRVWREDMGAWVRLFHCFVILPDGTILDPSRKLGMPSAAA